MEIPRHLLHGPQRIGQLSNVALAASDSSNPPPPKPSASIVEPTFSKHTPTTNPVVGPISHGWYFEDPVILKDFTLVGDVGRIVIPTRIATPTLSLAEK